MCGERMISTPTVFQACGSSSDNLFVSLPFWKDSVMDQQAGVVLEDGAVASGQFIVQPIGVPAASEAQAIVVWQVVEDVLESSIGPDDLLVDAGLTAASAEIIAIRLGAVLSTVITPDLIWKQQSITDLVAMLEVTEAGKAEVSVSPFSRVTQLIFCKLN
jgi:hypothetical protein